jgi:hypothetical protein
VEVEAISDPDLYAALKKYGPQLAVLLQTLQIYQNANAAIAQQTLADFQALGASGDLERQCIAEGQTAVTSAGKTLASLAAVNPIVVTVKPQ